MRRSLEPKSEYSGEDTSVLRNLIICSKYVKYFIFVVSFVVFVILNSCRAFLSSLSFNSLSRVKDFFELFPAIQPSQLLFFEFLSLHKGTVSSKKKSIYEFLLEKSISVFLPPSQLKRIATVQSGAAVLCRGEPSIAGFHFSLSLLKLERWVFFAF